MDKKAQTSGTFNLVAGIVVIFVVIVVISIVGITIATTLDESGIAKTNEGPINFVNETTTAMNATGYQISGTSGLTDCEATVTTAVNETDNAAINTANYSVSACFINASTASAPFLNFNWNVSGTYVYRINKATPITQNYSKGITEYFKNVPTLFTILFVVSLIALFVIVLALISRFSGGTRTSDL